eukprot:scaffold203989_cov28-Prasinocladus_malaysianus.AAC.2
MHFSDGIYDGCNYHESLMMQHLRLHKIICQPSDLDSQSATLRTSYLLTRYAPEEKPKAKSQRHSCRAAIAEVTCSGVVAGNPKLKPHYASAHSDMTDSTH